MRFVVLVIVVALVVGSVSWWLSAPPADSTSDDATDRSGHTADRLAEDSQPGSAAGQALPGRTVTGTRAGQAPVVHPAPAASHARGLVAVGDLGRQPDRNDPLDYGTVPLIQRGATPQVDAVYEAIDSGEHAARLTATVMPEPFDADAWERDPAPYLAVAEPGRVFQTAQPGPDVRRLTLAGPSTVMTVQGQPVSLRVLATPGAAVSWNAFDNGVFVESSLPAVTVQADADGIATATYLPTTGVIGDTSILAGSPMTSGQVRLTVITRLADAAGEQ